VTHDLGTPKPYRRVCRDLYLHETRLRAERPLPMPATLRPWVRRALSVLRWLAVAAVLFLMVCTVKGW
jgi:hypothetical protein